MHTVCELMLALVVLGADAPKTGALLQTLPADGAWSSFHVTVSGDEKDVSLTWTLRSVGSVLFDGKQCRILELEQVCDNGPETIYVYPLGHTTWRIVIPEASFGEGKDPLADAVRIWVEVDGNNPRAIASIDGHDPVLAAIVRGPSANLKLEPQQEKINWQRGELSCQVISGNQELNFAGAGLHLNSRILRNRDIPFAIAGLRQEMEVVVGTDNYTVTIKGSLRDHGTDAKPKLPQLMP